MKNIIDKYKKIVFPPMWLMLLLTIASIVGLVVVFTKSLEEHPVAYIVYILSAYTTIAVCIFWGKIIPKYYKSLKQKIYDHPLGNRYMTDIDFKEKTSLGVSLAINLAYSVFKLVTGVLYSSFWIGAVAVYYMILSLLRFILLRYMNSDKEKKGLLHEYKQSRLCGILLLILNLSLTGIVFQMVWQNRGYFYPGTLIFAAAAYTFYTVGSSMVDIIKCRKYKSPVLSAAKNIRFAAALVSLLSLETAMLVQFGDDEAYRFLMTSLTGCAVCLIVLGTSIYMIIQANRSIKSLQKRE